MWAIEQEHKDQGYKIICGVDEAGRGPLAGPVFAAAVILPFEIDIPGLNDSKKISASKRDKLFDIITDKSIKYSIASASHNEIDEINILQATYLAMNRALEGLNVINKLTKDTQDSFIALIDGNSNKGIKYSSAYVIGGDSKSASIAAASILAKVSRDRYMMEMATIYPQYNFEKHKGYGTKLHYEKIKEFGLCDIHRLTFLKKLISNYEN